MLTALMTKLKGLLERHTIWLYRLAYVRATETLLFLSLEQPKTYLLATVDALLLKRHGLAADFECSNPA